MNFIANRSPSSLQRISSKLLLEVEFPYSGWPPRRPHSSILAQAHHPFGTSLVRPADHSGRTAIGRQHRLRIGKFYGCCKSNESSAVLRLESLTGSGQRLPPFMSRRQSLSTARMGRTPFVRSGKRGLTLTTLARRVPRQLPQCDRRDGAHGRGARPGALAGGQAALEGRPLARLRRPDHRARRQDFFQL
jgi:hypothetical protein